MATDPSFASAVVLGAALLGAAETNLQVPTTTSTLFTAGQRVVTDGVTTISTPTLTSATAHFLPNDVGATLSGTGIPANTYVLAVVSDSTVTMSANATATGTGVSVTIQRPGGAKIEEVRINATATSVGPVTVGGVVYVFAHDGTTASLVDSIAVSAVTGSSSAVPFQFVKTYSNFWLRSGWSLRASQSIAGNANILKCVAFGGEF